MDAWGHATRVEEANGVTLIRGYDPATGLMTSLAADKGMIWGKGFLGGRGD